METDVKDTARVWIVLLN